MFTGLQGRCEVENTGERLQARRLRYNQGTTPVFFYANLWES